MKVELAFRRTGPKDRGRLSQWVARLYPTTPASAASPEVSLFVLGGEADLETEDDWPTAYSKAASAGRPVLGVLVDEMSAPSKLEAQLAGLLDAPWVDASDNTEDLGAVLTQLVPLPIQRAPRPASRPQLARRPPARDPALMRIATTSGGIGLLLLGTVGFGPASLFLFLSAVSFSISRVPEREEG